MTVVGGVCTNGGDGMVVARDGDDRAAQRVGGPVRPHGPQWCPGIGGLGKQPGGCAQRFQQFGPWFAGCLVEQSGTREQ